jgi:hypothetical protein
MSYIPKNPEYAVFWKLQQWVARIPFKAEITITAASSEFQETSKAFQTITFTSCDTEAYINCTSSDFTLQFQCFSSFVYLLFPTRPMALVMTGD